jgi:hypothetical protein
MSLNMEDPATEDRLCFAQSDIAHPFQKADIGRTGLRESILIFLLRCLLYFSNLDLFQQ